MEPDRLTTWQFDLRQGVVYDGTPFTAEDVVFSLNRALSETSDKGDYVSSIKAVALDDHTVLITTAAPDPTPAGRAQHDFNDVEALGGAA